MSMKETTPPAGPLLSLAANVTVPATAARFIVKDRFHRNPELNLSTIWDEFKRRFYGLIEEPVPETKLCAWQLLRNSHDAPIISELGGPAQVRTKVAMLFQLLQQQSNGEEGILQTNGYANIFYAMDKNGDLCAIRTGWDTNGWVIDAIGVDDPLAWNGKHRIFAPAR
jgi:hypothetical protein